MRAFEKIIGLTIVSALGLGAGGCMAPVSSTTDSAELEGSHLPAGKIHLEDVKDVALTYGWAADVLNNGKALFGTGGSGGSMPSLTTTAAADQTLMIALAQNSTKLTSAQVTQITSGLQTFLNDIPVLAPSYATYQTICQAISGGSSGGPTQSCYQQYMGTVFPYIAARYALYNMGSTALPSITVACSYGTTGCIMGGSSGGSSGGSTGPGTMTLTASNAFRGGIVNGTVWPSPSTGWVLLGGTISATADVSADTIVTNDSAGTAYEFAVVPIGSTTDAATQQTSEESTATTVCTAFANYSVSNNNAASGFCLPVTIGTTLTVMLGVEPPLPVHT